MAHECAHIRRRDYGKNLLYEVASVAIAYHPVAWFVKARIAQTREMICDEMASEKVLDAYSYAASLLRLAERLSGAGQFAASQAMGIFDADVLERRIMSMKQKKLKVSAGVRGAVTGAGAAVVLCMAAASAAMAGTIHVQTTKSSAGVGGENLRLYAGATCTYYDSHTKAHAGTCGSRPENAAEYYCAENGTAKFEPQMSCKGKVERTRGAEAAEQFAGKVYAIGKGVTAPVLLYAPEPKFTTQARLAKYQGVVVLQMVVTRQGRTEDIHVVRHLGMGLDRKAIEAAKLYRFKPAQYEGHPVAVKVKMEALFHLF